MKTMNQVFHALRKQNRKNYKLFIVCNFMSSLLITAYAAMINSPTVLTILPEGGDSRKQVMAIFVMTCVGCIVFTIYAASLFYRHKSREIGILLSLGTTKKKLSKQLLYEVALICISSCASGTLLGTPLSWLIWKGFRILIIDTNEMALHFSYKTYIISLTFSFLVLLSSFLLGLVFLRRSNIMDVINEQRKSEKIHDVKPWFAPLGILLILFGAIAGYSLPNILITKYHWFPPFWINLLYAPIFIGLYILLLHSVIRGFGRRKHPYKGIISRSMMKFQGRQTVNNMLVITVLLAGGCFALFYTPVIGTSSIIETSERPVDYAFHYRRDQALPNQKEIETLAGKYFLTIDDWKEVEFLNLGVDGQESIQDEGDRYHYEYAPLLYEANFLSQDSFNQMTGQNVTIEAGKYAAVLSDNGDGAYMIPTDVTKITNMATNQSISCEFQDFVYFSMMAADYYVLNNEDYHAISDGITPQWSENLIYFNIVEKDNYNFANDLFNKIVDNSSAECEISDYYDRIQKIVMDNSGREYWADTETLGKINYDQCDASTFRQFWKYMPQFRILDRNDFMKNFAVFLMMFIFIAIVCFAATLIIGFTRCITIAINNKQIFDNLKHLGAGPRFMYKSLKDQVSKVFSIPSMVGMPLIYLLYSMIMYANDNRITNIEIVSLLLCLILLIVLAFVIYLFYCFTLKKICKELNITKS